MSKRVIRVPLSPDGVEQAIREVEGFKAELVHKCGELVERLTDLGVEVARLQVTALGASYTGELAESIQGYYSPSACVGIIRAGAWYAAFVEYGTGVVGASASHPNPQGWAYDVKAHGEAGWNYFNDRDGRWHHTAGQPSRPFLYNTARELERQCERIAWEVFGR